MKRALYLPALLILFAITSRAQTAASCNVSDVQTVVTGASAGAVVIVPAGNCTWTTGLTLTVPITLQGAGPGNTNITQGMTGNQTHLISITEPVTGNFRVTQFSFLGLGYNHRAFKCGTAADRSYTHAPYRIDHNYFSGGADGSGSGAAGLIDNFSCAGVIDHNQFSTADNAEDIHNFGDGQSDWANDVVIGGPDMLFVEANQFSISDTGGNFNGNSAIQNYNGARIVFRNNVLNGSQFDAHGTATAVCSTCEGTRWYEIYNNTWILANNTVQDKFMDLRAGSGLVWGNKINPGSQPTNATITFREEDTGNWPLAYQVGSGINGGTNGHNTCGATDSSPAYVWANGSMPVSTQTPNTTAQNRDWFWTTSNNQPTIHAQQLASDTCATTYTYTPYPYPHPLTGGTQAPVATPAISPSAGAYASSPQTVSITDATGGATICYTTDGTRPTANGAGTCTHGTTYSSSFSQAVPSTVEAIGSLSGSLDSNVAINNYSLTATAANPVIVPMTGAFTSAVNVSISCSTASSTIYYTPDGTSPTHSSIVYSGPFNEPVPGTVKALCAAGGDTDSAIVTATYTTSGLQAPTGLRATVTTH